MSKYTSISTKYPGALINWAGHRDGGVRKPFHPESGRPTGVRIHTPLLERLKVWSKSLASGDSEAPSVILLVGGPGNGKTDAVESCIEFLDDSFSSAGKLSKAFTKQFNVQEGSLPPRKAIVNLKGAGIDVPTHLSGKLVLVQDATEGDPASGRDAEDLLLEDLDNLLRQKRKDIYLCCVNRGILAHSAVLSEGSSINKQTRSLLNQITAAATSGPTSPRCWPLEDFEQIAVWPMDVESLVESPPGSDELPVAHQILNIALDEASWAPECDNGDHCPFCQNRKLLSKPGKIEALVSLLRYYEFGSGKRWTFRDLFSLVPYLLVGDYTELVVDGSPMPPCEWTASKIGQLRAAGPEEKKQTVRLELVSRLYYHRLFARWPYFGKGEIRKARAVLNSPAEGFGQGIRISKGFFSYLSQTSSRTRMSSGDIPSRMSGSFCELLDPALSPPGSGILNKEGERVSAGDIEDRFSLSIGDGLKLVSRQLVPLERELLKSLASADEALVDENFKRTQYKQVQILRSTVRQFSARLAKRSIASRESVCKDVEHFENYNEALSVPGKLSLVRKQLKKLLHDERNRFRASLVTTFGQPVAKGSRDITLLTPAIQIKDFPQANKNGRPPEPVPYFRVDDHIVPVTFQLFKALSEVVDGLHDASLPSEIFALLNGIKSLAAGNIVRNNDVLSDDSVIKIGNTGLYLEFDGAEFFLREEAQA
jgi:hypothetical protein